MQTIFLDLETTGLNPFTDRILCVGMKINEKPTEIQPNVHSCSILFDSCGAFALGGHNISFDLKFLSRHLRCYPSYYIDTKIIYYYKNPHESHRLKDLAEKYLGVTNVIRRTDLLGQRNKKIKMEEIDENLLHKYCIQDVDLSYNLWKKSLE